MTVLLLSLRGLQQLEKHRIRTSTQPTTEPAYFFAAHLPYSSGDRPQVRKPQDKIPKPQAHVFRHLEPRNFRRRRQFRIPLRLQLQLERLKVKQV